MLNAVAIGTLTAYKFTAYNLITTFPISSYLVVLIEIPVPVPVTVQGIKVPGVFFMYNSQAVS
jgi:ABC-type sulfate transport system permease component